MILLKNVGFKGGQTINLSFEGSDQAKIEQSLFLLQKHAFPFLNLKFQIGHTGASVIRIRIEPSDKPKANITGQTTGIGTTTPIVNVYKFSQGVLLHEFGHAMGMYHEHQNPSPNNPLKWNEAAAYDLYVNKQGWTKEQVKAQILNREDKTKTLYTAWDPNSIMNYSIPNSLLATPVKTFRNQEYSDGDKAWFKLKYG